MWCHEDNKGDVTVMYFKSETTLGWENMALWEERQLCRNYKVFIIL
jgi:hypothetical protein